jgi:hypothetical protein
MQFERAGKYHQKSPCGYTISAQRVEQKWVYAAWPPNYTANTPTLGVGTKQQAIDFCLQHKTKTART